MLAKNSQCKFQRLPHLQQQLVQKEINDLSMIADLIVLVLFKKIVIT